MSQKQSKTNKYFEDQMNFERKRSNDLFERSLKPSDAEVRFKEGADAWDSWVKGKDYRTPPAGNILNYNLWSPAQYDKQLAKARNITGIGASALGGDQSVALQLAREHQAADRAQQGSAAWEQAIMGQDAFFKGNDLNYAQFTKGNLMNVMGQSNNNLGMYTGGYKDTAPKPFNWGALLGGVMGSAATMLAPGFGAGGMFNK